MQSSRHEWVREKEDGLSQSDCSLPAMPATQARTTGWRSRDRESSTGTARHRRWSDLTDKHPEPYLIGCQMAGASNESKLGTMGRLLRSPDRYFACCDMNVG